MRPRHARRILDREVALTCGEVGRELARAVHVQGRLTYDIKKASERLQSRTDPSQDTQGLVWV
jgi:hypothetical protein